MNELASYFRSKELVLRLKETLDKSFKSNKLLFGKVIMTAISEISDEIFSQPVLELLIDNQIINKEKAGTTLRDYLFSYDENKAKKYFSKEADAAEVLENAYFPNLKSSEEFKILVTVPNDPMFPETKDVPLIYPAIKKLIQKSKATIDITTPFLDAFGTKKMIPDLLTAGKRGVEIKIIIRGYFDIEEGKRNRESVKLIFDAFKEKDLDKMIKIKDYFKKDATSLKQIFAIHSKILISDDKECYLGSANITTTSLYSNFEAGILFNGKEVKKIKSLFSKLWNASNPIPIIPK